MMQWIAANPEFVIGALGVSCTVALVILFALALIDPAPEEDDDNA